MNTHAQVLERLDIAPPDAALADIEVLVLTGPQRQGDVGIFPRPKLGKAEFDRMTPVPPEGVAVVRGEATGNTHVLLADVDSTVLWAPHVGREGGVTLGVLAVAEGSTAFLVHTDEHGVNAIGPGTYVLHGKREQAAEIRRVAD